MALAVVLGASGCCGSIPLSLRLGGSEWASAATRGVRRVVWGVAARARASRWCPVWRLAAASPAARSLAHLLTWALLAYATLLLAEPPPVLR